MITGYLCTQIYMSRLLDERKGLCLKTVVSKRGGMLYAHVVLKPFIFIQPFLWDIYHLDIFLTTLHMFAELSHD
jgi:hypothetical protein